MSKTTRFPGTRPQLAARAVSYTHLVADFNISGGSWTHTADNSEKVVPTGVLEKLRERSDIENLGVVYYHPVDYDKLTEEKMCIRDR